MTDITDEDLECIALELNRAWERIAELEKQVDEAKKTNVKSVKKLEFDSDLLIPPPKE